MTKDVIMNKEVPIEAITISECSWFTKIEFMDWCKSIIKAMDDAEDKGFVNIKAKFKSTIEPYDDYPGDPELLLYGDRPYTEDEIKIQEENKAVESLAKKLGCSFYEASVVINLQSHGKLKGL